MWVTKGHFWPIQIFAHLYEVGYRARHDNCSDTLLLEEFGICRGLGRIDMVVVNTSLEGYEIKSDRDDMRRIERQVELYSKVLDRATVVVGERHLSSIFDIVPGWWGVLYFGSGPRIESLRHSKKNRSVDARALVELMWYDEAIGVLEERSAARGVRGKPRSIVWDRVCETLAPQEIAAKVRERIKARNRIITAA